MFKEYESSNFTDGSFSTKFIEHVCEIKTGGAN